MTTPLPYFLIQHAYFFGTVPATLPVVPVTIQTPSFNQSLIVSQQTEPRKPDYTYSSAEIGAHKVHTHLHTWNEARVHCAKEGGYLAIINSIAEAEAIVNLLKKSNIKNSWIGAHDFFEEGQFVTIHDESLEKAGFNVWHGGEPNNLRNNENCVILNLGGKLNDATCVERHYFTCESLYVP